MVSDGEDAASAMTEQGSTHEREAQLDLLGWTLAVLAELEALPFDSSRVGAATTAGIFSTLRKRSVRSTRLAHPTADELSATLPETQ
jgi:hypothetical protein